MAHDVFISYSTKDKTVADVVCTKLEECRIRTWIAPRDVPAGANFAESIIEAIDNCKVFVLVWSASTNTSEHVLNEINQAFDQGVSIIPFRIQDVQPSRALRYYIGRTHWLDAMTPPLEKHIATLISTILANLGRKPESITRPVPIEPEREKQRQKVSEQSHQSEETMESAVKQEGKVKRTALSELTPKQKQKENGSEIQPINMPAGKFVRFIPVVAAVLVAGVLLVLWSSGRLKSSSSDEKKQAEMLSTATVGQSMTAPSGTTAVSSASYNQRTVNPENQHLYSFFKIDKTWKGASQYCKSMGGYLVSIESESENLYVYKLASGGITYPYIGHTWLGATDEVEEGIWIWESGQSFNYQNWQYEPNSVNDPDNNQDYMAFYKEGERRTWWDIEEGRRYFVCEWDTK